MTSIEMVRPRGQGRGATSATTEDAETLLPASEPPAGARTRNAAPVAVAQGNSVGLFERIGDVADAMLPPPPRPRDPADRRRVWTWATVSFLLMCVMFGSVAGGPGGRRTRTREMALDGPSSPIGNQQRDVRSVATGPGLADDSKRANAESVAESPRDAYAPDVDDASYTSESNDAASGGAIPIPIPRTKGTCVTREARAPPFEWPSDPIVPVANGGQWRELADALAAEASNATTELVLVGDSITEAWRGTSFGAARAEYASAPEILARRLGEYSPLPLAIAGDTTGNVLWRLRNGGFPTPKRREAGGGLAPAYAVVLIGTNDLSRSIFARRSSREDDAGGNGFSQRKKPSPACVSDDDVASLFAEGVPKTVAGIIAVVEAIVELAPETKIVVLGITPRGERVGNTKVSYLQPSVWSAAIDATNAVVERVLENGKRKGEKGKGGGGPFGGSRRYRNVVFQPCAEPFLVRDAAGGGKRVDERLMRDGLHPNGAGGFDALGECVVDGVEKAKRTR